MDFGGCFKFGLDSSAGAEQSGEVAATRNGVCPTLWDTHPTPHTFFLDSTTSGLFI
jgi:hypothetical protein